MRTNTFRVPAVFGSTQPGQLVSSIRDSFWCQRHTIPTRYQYHPSSIHGMVASPSSIPRSEIVEIHEIWLLGLVVVVAMVCRLSTMAWHDHGHGARGHTTMDHGIAILYYCNTPPRANKYYIAIIIYYLACHTCHVLVACYWILQYQNATRAYR